MRTRKAAIRHAPRILEGIAVPAAWIAARPRRLASLVLVASISALALLPAAGTAGEALALTRAHVRSQSACRVPARHKALIHTPQLVVWEIARAHREAATITTYYACSPPHGAKRAIGRAATEGEEYGSTIVYLTAAGPYVGLIEVYGSKGGSSETLTVQNARTGETFTIRVSDHPSSYTGGAEPQIQELRELGNPVGEGANPYILNTNGDLAWIGQTEPTPGQPRQDVLYLHDQHQTREVTAAPEITDLTFNGTLLRWRSAGVAHATGDAKAIVRSGRRPARAPASGEHGELDGQMSRSLPAPPAPLRARTRRRG
jgi:hypothetical protein